MKITKQHRECFKEALEYLNDSTEYCCLAIGFTGFSLEIKEQCKAILFHYFRDEAWREVLWLPVIDTLSCDELLTCRLIALYTLIYAPL